MKELEDLDVIEKVDGPTQWVNPLITVEKPNGDVRLCLDMREANRAIIRERQPIPTVEETVQEMGEMKVFTKMDLNMAFHQVELHPHSRDVTTFAAPNGQLTLNFEKLDFGVRKVNFMGHTMSDMGLQVTDDKIKAMAAAPEPRNAAELRSFLGSALFSSKFIPDFATLTQPLWELTRSQVRWRWTRKEQEAFTEVKRRLTAAPVLAYYRVGADTRLVTDTSPVGLGAVLQQRQEDGVYKAVYYASRKLRDPETRYSQFEKEALAVKWACEKFHLYLYGWEFEVHTDHKPLIQVYGGQAKPPNARLERWLLSLQQYRFTIRYIPGWQNSADGLSRLPIEGGSEADSGISAEDYAYCVVMDSVPAAMTAGQVERESSKDPLLCKVRLGILEDQWADLEHTVFTAVRDELWVVGQVVMRGSRIVLPEKLQKQALALAHEGHQGVVRTKSRLREKAWWPRMDKEVEDFVKVCYPCQLVGTRLRPEPIRSTPLPQGPWDEIAVDLCGPLPNGESLLVVIDYFSRWPEVVWMRNTNAQAIIKCMEAMFATHGLPYSVRSDNGPQFVAAEFGGFLEYLGIQHTKGIPYWPQSNGEVERFNRTLMKCIKIANVEKTDWKRELRNFLFQYRTTPHTVTGVSPAEMLMGRKLWNKLPKIQMDAEPMDELQWQRQVRERDARRKRYEKEYGDKTRGARASDLEVGDQVLLKQNRRDKLTTPFEA